eukprot:scaffold16949_cov54-Phaeocystis_antarctica.AAC.2
MALPVVFIDFFAELQALRVQDGRRGYRPGNHPSPQSPEGVSKRGSALLSTLSELLPAAKPARAQTRCSDARSKDGNLLKGPWAGPKPHAAASLRTPGSHLVQVAGRHLELLSGRPGRDEDPAASG